MDNGSQPPNGRLARRPVSSYLPYLGLTTLTAWPIESGGERVGELACRVSLSLHITSRSQSPKQFPETCKGSGRGVRGHACTLTHRRYESGGRRVSFGGDDVVKKGGSPWHPAGRACFSCLSCEREARVERKLSDVSRQARCRSVVVRGDSSAWGVVGGRPACEAGV